MLGDSSWKGAMVETAIQYAATRLGLTVLKPISDGKRYDLVIDTGPRLLRVQCKWASRKENVIAVRIRTSRFTPGGYVRSTYAADEIDGIAAYCHELDRCFWRSRTSRGRASCICDCNRRVTTSAS